MYYIQGVRFPFKYLQMIKSTQLCRLSSSLRDKFEQIVVISDFRQKMKNNDNIMCVPNLTLNHYKQMVDPFNISENNPK